MAPSIPSPEVIKLGNKLVKEFSKGDRINATLRWMAHYLAEIMDKAGKLTDPVAKKKAENECVALILKLWKHREFLPGEVRPLSKLEGAVAALSALNEEDADFPVWNRYRNIEDSSPWGKFLQDLRWNADHIIRIIIFMVVNLDILSKEKEWLEFPDMLSQKEKEMIEGLDRLIKSYGEVTIKIRNDPNEQAPVPHKKRLEASFDKIESLLQEQLKLLADVRAYTLKPAKAKNKRRT